MPCSPTRTVPQPDGGGRPARPHPGDDPGCLGPGLQHRRGNAFPAAPVIVDFTAVQESGNSWTFRGRVTGRKLRNLTVQLGGIPSLAGRTATVDESGWFVSSCPLGQERKRAQPPPSDRLVGPGVGSGRGPCGSVTRHWVQPAGSAAVGPTRRALPGKEHIHDFGERL